MRNTKTKYVLAMGLTLGLAVPAVAAEPKIEKAAAKPTFVESAPQSQIKAELDEKTRAYLERSKEHPSHNLPRGHYKPMLSTKLVLKANVTKVRAEIVQIVDGMVIYVAEGSVDRTRYQRLTQLPKNAIRRATFARGIETLARRKVGETVTLHLQADPKGFAYVTNVTR